MMSFKQITSFIKRDLNMKNRLLVSVFMITYNHEKYIEEAIGGVLMQETNFEYELIIADDCSPDNTPIIINDIIKNHPKGHRIKYFRHKENLGMQANGLFALQQCTGKYIALCEGDDYWTDPLKLQRQVDFLEMNSDFVMCFTNSIIKNDKTGEEKIAKINLWDVCDTKELLKHNSLEGPKYGEIINSAGHTSSIVFRNNVLTKFPDWFLNCFIGDEPLFLMLSKFGKAKFINEFCSVYRDNPLGISTVGFSYEKDYRGRIYMYKMLNSYFEKKYKKDINTLIARYYLKLTKLYVNRKKPGKAIISFFSLLFYDRSLIINKILQKR